MVASGRQQQAAVDASPKLYSPVCVPRESDSGASALLSETDGGAHECANKGRAPRSYRAVPAVLLVSVLAATIAASIAMRGRTLRRIHAENEVQVKAATWEQEFDSNCGKMEVDVEYVDEESGWGTNFDHIPTPEMCCAMCQGEPRCQAFTWVKEAGLDGCPSQCWLKGGTGKPRPAPGLVSGLPPPRRKLDNVPSGTGGDGGSLFCMSLMVPGTDEEELLLWQYKNKASIFACDGTAIYSNKKIELAHDVVTLIIDSDLKCEYGGDSQSALNSWIFIALWQRLIDDGDYAKHDWIVKVDPDCVFFPDRLGLVLAEHKGDGYVNNCKYGMHGPIEVLSKGAIDALAADYKGSFDGKAPKQCVEKQDFGQWGEDMFLDQCLGNVLGVGPSPVDVRLMCESHCDCPAWYWCMNGTDRVSFHPFKTVAAYQNCMANALGGTPMADGEVQPTPAPGPKAKVLEERDASEDNEDIDDTSDDTSDDEEQSSDSSADKASSEEQKPDPSPAPASPSQADRFDCNAGLDKWGASWSDDKKDWCCKNKEKGCDGDSGEDGGVLSSDEQNCKDYGCVSKWDPDRSCQCNPDCKSHGSCCDDYDDACGSLEPAEPKKTLFSKDESCANYGCGGEYNADQGCQCTQDCKDYDNCCADFEDECEDLLGGGSSDPADPAAGNLDAGDSPASDTSSGDDPTPAPSTTKATTKTTTEEVQDEQDSNSSPTPADTAAEDSSSESDSGDSQQQPAPGPRAQTFYMYRAQSEASYPLENINTADLAGVLWYLHNEVIVAQPRKYKIDRIKRYKVTVKNTWEFWNVHKRQFSPFVAYDAARCTTPICKDIYNQYGFLVGCQLQDLNVAAYLSPNQTNWNCEKGAKECYAPVWYSLPGECPSQGMDNNHIAANKVGIDVTAWKSEDCVKRMPGGRCDKATGAPDCTYSYEEAGEIFLNELVGIEDYEDFWNHSYSKCLRDKATHQLPEGEECRHKKEYDVDLDEGVGNHFWDGKNDKEKCAERMEAVRQLFKKHFPEFPADFDQPACEFDMFYENEFDWDINHTNSVKSDWWDKKMSVEEAVRQLTDVPQH